MHSTPSFALFLLASVSIANARLGTNVVGGDEVTDPRFASVVSLQRSKGTHFCGGTIVSDEYILTAAHCLRHGLPARIVQPRDYSLDEGGVLLHAMEAIVHPFYGGVTDNDIALIRYQSSVALPHMELQWDMRADFDKVISVGWGYRASGGTLQDRMIGAQLDVITTDRCREAYGEQIDERNVCTLGKWNRATKMRDDQCTGDSGGPSVVESGGGKLIQVGITSYGLGCGMRDYGGVSSRVVAFRDFIEMHVHAPTPSPTRDDMR